MEVIKDWPPVTKVLVVGAALLSVGVHSQVLNMYNFVFIRQLVFQVPPQIWRVFSTFFITGAGISILFDAYFLYTYSSALESQSTRFREHGSYFVYIIFVCSIITGLGGYVLQGPFLLKALIISLAYTFSQDNPHSNVTIFVLSFPAKYLPYALLFISIVSSGWQGALVEGTGLVAAHAYDFLTRIWPTFGGGRNYVQTPTFIKNFFLPGDSRTESRAYGTATRPAEHAPQGGWSDSRGPGRRLGD